MREFRQGRPVGSTKEHRTAYAQRVDACGGGKVTQGVVFLRGVLTHHLVKQVEPVPTPLYPPFYPGPDTFPGANFTWLTTDVLLAIHPDVPKQQVAQFEHGRSHVAGQMMLPTLRQAIDFLLNDPVIVTLEYM